MYSIALKALRPPYVHNEVTLRGEAQVQIHKKGHNNIQLKTGGGSALISSVGELSIIQSGRVVFLCVHFYASQKK